MTWYFWVWGVMSCLALLVVAIGAGISAIYLWETRKFAQQRAVYEAEIRALEKRCKGLDVRLESRTLELLEARKGQNEFGKIIP